MKPGRLLQQIHHDIAQNRHLYWVLLDPDDFSCRQAAAIARQAQQCGVDGLLIGGSLLHTTRLDSFVAEVKKEVTIPVILFPGDATQISKSADGILFLSL
ncbi:MAG: hypothetical protein JW795_08065, partial [Chitinivibrionales bacterium]|nr:hypothetical protein [Chitinivibrionales bacterium]